tara:strand:+ start:324 stop:722 length:399 start_codon:yes stop_codon:yes gene_type:complete
MRCPCDSNITYALCCGLFIDKHHQPKSAEALMRSRYCAYYFNHIDYIMKTMRGKPLMGFSKKDVLDTNSFINWQSLEIIEATENTVEFKAVCLTEDGNSSTLHEISMFKQKNAQWFYIGALSLLNCDKPLKK